MSGQDWRWRVSCIDCGLGVDDLRERDAEKLLEQHRDKTRDDGDTDGVHDVRIFLS